VPVPVHGQRYVWQSNGRARAVQVQEWGEWQAGKPGGIWRGGLHTRGPSSQLRMLEEPWAGPHLAWAT
jgi:hypothetical protein